ncbi:hypothetical protein [Sphingomonas sp. M1-B02]|uniref:hypothetical protein n=1 Tax=Sphingomonas sp. M1-B02 TaxID=3114300 RepID=UPI002240670D|nr:hypothetical protein [Sphingomonas sp. S6-11]UZK67703.1 hypothetical protein OKW87_07710 [Sphingomonas sp. S6-11]
MPAATAKGKPPFSKCIVDPINNRWRRNSDLLSAWLVAFGTESAKYRPQSKLTS